MNKTFNFLIKFVLHSKKQICICIKGKIEEILRIMNKKCFPLDLSEVRHYSSLKKRDALESYCWLGGFLFTKNDLDFTVFSLLFNSSFMATNNKQTNVQLIRKFDDWEYSWYKSLNQRMPWFDAKGTGRMALLTTSSSPTHNPSGSIIWAGTDRYPADWISAVGMRNPGVIWYWVNEDDCDEDRKPGRMFPSSFFSFFFFTIRLAPVVQVLDR